MKKQPVKIETIKNVSIVVFEATSIPNPDQISDAAEDIREFVAKKQPSAIVFDFSCVKFFSSQVLGLLLDTRTRMKSYDGRVVISGINPQLHRVFSITNLDRIFDFFDDKQSAVNALNA